jgi:hypothetical protein
MHAASHSLLHVTLFPAYRLAFWRRRSILTLLLLVLVKTIGQVLLHARRRMGLKSFVLVIEVWSNRGNMVLWGELGWGYGVYV